MMPNRIELVTTVTGNLPLAPVFPTAGVNSYVMNNAVVFITIAIMFGSRFLMA